MSPDPNAGSVRPPSGGSGGDQAAAARFEIVLRGYDRRQVEEHISTLERTIAQQREELQKAGSGVSPAAETSVFAPAAKKPAASSSGSSGSGLNPEMISSFTTRLQSILQAAEEEAEEVRGNARAFAQAEEQSSRSRLDELERRRQSVLSELGRVRTQLDGLLSGSAGSSSAAGAPAAPSAADKPKEAAAEAPRSEAPRSDAPRPDAPRPVAPAGPGPGMRPEPPRPPPGQSIGGRPGGAPGYGQPQQQPHPAIHRPTGPPPGPGRPGGPLPMRQGQPQAPQPAQQGSGQQGSGQQGSGQQGLPQPPSSQQGSQQGSQPKPRPTPRPRPNAPGSNLPGVEMTQGPAEPGKRNGNGRSDDEGGFGTGAR